MKNLWYQIRFFWYAYFTNYFYKDHFLDPPDDDVLLYESFRDNKFHYDWQLPSWDRQPWTTWVGQNVIYLPSQVKIEDNTLVLTTDHYIPQKEGEPYFKSGEITSTDFLNYTYGFAEVCMIPNQTGWSCPWNYQSDNGKYRPFGEVGYEMDFGEFECDTPRAFTVTVHKYAPDGKSSDILGTARMRAKRDLTKNYHVFGCDWQKNYIDFYFNGKKIYHYTGEIPNNNCFLIVDMCYKTGELPVSSYIKQIRVQKQKI